MVGRMSLQKAPYVFVKMAKQAKKKVPNAQFIFMETYNEKDMKEAGIDIHFMQDNQFMSTKGVLRGLHFQKQFLIPEGFAHGFLVLSDETEFCYKVNDFWHPNDEGGMAWNDPKIGIQWPQLKGKYNGSQSAKSYTLEDGTAPNLSDKDQKRIGRKDTFKF